MYKVYMHTKKGNHFHKMEYESIIKNRMII